jgi:hypothetical protein
MALPTTAHVFQQGPTPMERRPHTPLSSPVRTCVGAGGPQQVVGRALAADRALASAPSSMVASGLILAHSRRVNETTHAVYSYCCASEYFYT